jgi:hypothetical protein
MKRCVTKCIAKQLARRSRRPNVPGPPESVRPPAKPRKTTAIRRIQKPIIPVWESKSVFTEEPSFSVIRFIILVVIDVCR